MSELWRPDPGRRARAQLTEFVNRYSMRGAGDYDYAALHRESIDEPGKFWAAVWAYCEVVGDPGERVWVPADDMRDVRFFPDARLNFACNLLRRNDERVALIARAEGRATRHVSYAELRRDVLAFAGFLAAHGVGPGDRVGALMPNVCETVVAALGAAAVGAVFSSASPDFGTAAALDRFGQLELKVLVGCDGYRYNGKLIDCRRKLADVAAALPSLACVIVVDCAGLGTSGAAIPWPDTLHAAPGAFVELPFDHPLYVMFSSGTTGKPKAIVHRAGGSLLQHLKEHRLQCDIRAGDRVFYFTTCGWMMWNWLVSALAAEATLVLFDGSPSHPDLNVLFDMADAERVTFFGTSAKFIDAVKKSGLQPIVSHDLSSVRTIASTGSPLAPDSFDFVYRSIKADTQLASISGGTDILSCFVGANPWGPVCRGEIQAAGLGMAVEVWDPDGNAVVGKRGELVCTRAFPSMPLGFLGDDGGERYRRAYFDQWPGTWCHGDFALQTEHGGYVILGRSDAVLNPGGVRIGTAEIYRQVEQMPEVIEAIAVGQDWQDDVRVILFVVLGPDIQLDAGLQDAIRSRIRAGATPRHVPAKIIAVPDIPRTKSGKISELAVRDVVHGRPVPNTDALANPEALRYFSGLSELRD